jgi:hypothetical protein
VHSGYPVQRAILACIFHQGGYEIRVFTKRINLPGRLLSIVAPAQFVPIHFQEKSAVTG